MKKNESFLMKTADNDKNSTCMCVNQYSYFLLMERNSETDSQAIMNFSIDVKF